MFPPAQAVNVLVSSESAPDATVVKKLLDAEFAHVFTSTEPASAVKDFERCCPAVLVLAFGALEQSERYYLGLFRLSDKIHIHPHRTIILCHKDKVRRAYELCRKELFEFYFLFWPATLDASRLPMSVHQALRDLAARGDGGPSAAEFAAQARRLGELETLLEQWMAQGGECVESAGRAVVQAELAIGAALDGFSRDSRKADCPMGSKSTARRAWKGRSTESSRRSGRAFARWQNQCNRSSSGRTNSARSVRLILARRARSTPWPSASSPRC